MEENIKQLAVDPPVIKIAIVGPECTGKTTLARSLAEHYQTEWVPEFARDYLQQKFNRHQSICEPGDMLPILRGQIASENEAAKRARIFLFSDTCALQSKVYSELYYGNTDPALEKAARKHKYDLFFLTHVDVPWEKDDLRDRPNDRENYFQIFRDALVQYDKPFIVLSGNRDERLQQAVGVLDQLVFAQSLRLTSQDFLQVRSHRVDLRTIEQHLGFFRRGIAKADLDRPATIGDGIVRLTESEFAAKADAFPSAMKGLTIEKFVPASGAASRMFKFLSEFLNDFDAMNESINAYINRKNANELRIFLTGLEKFPFYHKIWRQLKEGYADFDTWDRGSKVYHFIKYMLEPQYFNFCNRPKGVLPFHKYKGHVATPVEEHLGEAVRYATSSGVSRLHFTVSEEHRKLFEDAIQKVKPKIESESGTTIETSYSYQDASTDTIAVNPDNTPFRDKKGNLVFRPGGHGALIRNLGQRDADIVFIKNIDNVMQNHKEVIALYKKALGVILIDLRNEVFRCLRKLDQGQVHESDLDAMVSFARERLNMETIDDFDKYTTVHKIDYLRGMLNRPIRVCGMVKNEGEPGGGPFWVRDRRGIPRLQIVESSQVDMSNQAQVAILKGSTHFNPVDLVCSIRDYRGEKFDLGAFVDHESGFIVDKNKEGKPLKAYELPGLWNGAMAKWITVFVEVPLITFNPVKTVNDLLKPAHQENGQG